MSKNFYKNGVFDEINGLLRVLSLSVIEYASYQHKRNFDSDMLWELINSTIRQLSKVNEKTLGRYVAGYYVSASLNELCQKEYGVDFEACSWKQARKAANCIEEHVNDVAAIIGELAELSDKSPKAIYDYLDKVLRVAYITGAEDKKLAAQGYRTGRLKGTQTGLDIYRLCEIDIEWVAK